MSSDDEDCVPAGDADDIGDEEIKAPRCMRKPGQPSKADKLAHDCLHINYRSWCRYCVMGKGRHRHHLSKKNRQRARRKAANSEKEAVISEDEVEAGVPMLSMDYCFMGTHRKAANRVPVLVARDETTKWIMAYMVEKKGAVDWVIDALVNDIKNLGYGGMKIAVKTD